MMKTAEEWFITTAVPIHPDCVEKMRKNGWRCVNLDDIKQIRLEAYKAGMTEAAEMAKRRTDGSLGQSKARARLVSEILTARDNKTSI